MVNGKMKKGKKNTGRPGARVYSFERRRGGGKGLFYVRKMVVKLGGFWLGLMPR